MPSLVKCKHCNKEFEVVDGTASSFCSEECRKAHKAQLRKARRPKQARGRQKSETQVDKKAEEKQAVAVEKKAKSKAKEAAHKVIETAAAVNTKGINLDDLFPAEVWEQRPTDIETFLFDRNYLGNSWLDSDNNRTMFPFWQEMSKKIFPLPMKSPYNTIIFSGSTGCVDCDTEFFTGSGWKRIADWEQGDKVLQWDKNGVTELVTPIAYIKKPSTELYKLETKYGVDATLSGDHRFVYITSKGNLYEEPFAKVVERYSRSGKGTHDKVITSFDYMGGTGVKLSDLEIRLMVAVIADGHFRDSSNRCCIRIKKLYKKERLISILKELNLEYSRNDDPIQEYSRFYFKAPRREKIYTKFWYSCNKDQLKLISEELPWWDGDKEPKGNRLRSCRTKVKETADFIQFVYSSLGYRATIITNDRTGEEHFSKSNGKTYIRKGPSYRIHPTLRNQPSLRNTHGATPIEKIKPIDGYEYCFKVPSSYLVLRKNDKIFITGNCGKTSAAMGICLAYYLHIVMCLRNPHKYFGLADQKNIVFVVLNIVTKQMSYKNAWGMIHKMLLKSPWFMARGVKSEGKRPEWTCTTKPVELIFGRNADDLIGLDILFAFMDEISFYRNASIESQIKAATDVYNAAWERMKSRFVKFEGIFDGLMVLASSKRTDQSFLESFIKKILESQDSRRVLVIDKPRWEVLPPESYCGKRFPVAVGDKFRPSQIIREDQVQEFTEAGYKIYWPPIENYGEFERDMNNALTNIAGISVGQISSFLRGDLVTSCVDKELNNPFKKSIIYSGFKDTTQYYEYFDTSVLTPEDYTLPLFVHLDASLGRDGNSIVGVLADYAINQKDTSGNYQQELHYRELFKIKVRAPQGTETGLDKNTKFILWLSQRFNLQAISHDQFQSKSLHQDLLRKGINVVQQSVDAVKDGINPVYAVFKDVLYEKRVSLLDDEDQLNELVSLEKYENGKVDKPQGGCFTGDTKVRLVDGRSLTFLELVDEFNSGKTNFVYSMNLNTRVIEAKPISRAWLTRRNQKLVKVILDNGEEIKCTPDHPFMDRDGNYIKAIDLVNGTSLMPLYTKYPSRGSLTKYRLIYQPMIDRWNYEHQLFSGAVLKKGFVIHHKDCNKGNNNPTNLVQLSRDRHIQVHQLLSTGACSPEAIAKRTDSRLKWYKEIRGTAYEEELRRKIKAGVYRFYGKDLEEIESLEKAKILWIETNSGKKYSELTLKERSRWGVKYHHHLNPKLSEVYSSALSSFNGKTSSERATGRSWYNNGIYEKFLKPGDIVPEGYIKGRAIKLDTHIKQENRHWGKCKNRRNHKVVSVTWLEGTYDVYDLAIPDNHNFALDSGVFVHNSDDVAQCLAGAVYLASLAKEEMLASGVVLLKQLDSSDTPGTGAQVSPEKLIEDEMTKHFATYSPEAIKTTKQSTVHDDWEKFFGKDKKKDQGDLVNPGMYWG